MWLGRLRFLHLSVTLLCDATLFISCVSTIYWFLFILLRPWSAFKGKGESKSDKKKKIRKELWKTSSTRHKTDSSYCTSNDPKTQRFTVERATMERLMTTYQTASSYKCTAQPVAAHTELTFNPHTLREYSTDVILYSTNITTLMKRTKTV